MTEIYKYILRFKNTYNLTNAHLLESQSPRAKRCALNCIANRASQILQTFPIKIKDSFSLKIFFGIAIPVHVASPTFTTWDLLKCNHYIVYFL